MDPSRLRAWAADCARPAIEAVHRLARAVASTAAAREGHPPRALVVGGFVRDGLLGRLTFDVDVEVHGVEAGHLETLLGELFGSRLHAVGRSFGVFKIRVEDGHDLDVSIPRADSKTGPGHKGFAVSGNPFLGLEEASRRRDFTINTLALDPLDGTILDPWNGIADLRDRLLRAVDPALFGDDPLRVWRGVQFVGRLSLGVEPATFGLMRGIVARQELAELSRERVTEELRKLLVEGERPSAGLVLARDLGILRAQFPELEAMAGCPQEEEWHPEGDVWVHTAMVLDRAVEVARRPEWGFDETERLQVALGALLHDVGKPLATTRAMRNGVLRIVSPGHENAGEAPARAVLSRLTFGEEVERAVLAIVKWHALPFHLHRSLEKGEMAEHAYANAVRKLVKRIHPVPWRVLLAATEADFRGRTMPDVDGPYAAGERFTRTVLENAYDAEPVRPLVLGRDVLALGVPPGPEVGRLVAAVEEARDRGEIATREEGLEVLRRLVKERGQVT
jgi:tRNA nucleotidyltransferase (CCA-adding enzyme)